MTRIIGATTYDIRFPTSRSGAGSDAMNIDPDYSAAYVSLATDHPDGITGHGLTFTIGRGTEVCVAAIEALAPHVVGADVDELVGDLGGFWRRLVTDSQLRWLGPEKGVIHLATAAIVNAVWDLHAKLERKPLWKLLADMTPEQVVGCIDFRYIEDALTRDEALSILHRNVSTKAERERILLAEGFPAYTTSAGWHGYPESTLPGRAREAIAAGFTHLKLKVGGDIESDLRRARLVRDLRRPRLRVRRPPARAFRRPRPCRRRPLSRADDAGLQHRDPAGVARGVRVPRRPRLVEGGGSSRMTTGRHRPISRRRRR